MKNDESILSEVDFLIYINMQLLHYQPDIILF